MTDHIHVEGLLLRTTLGLDEEQRSKRQDVRIDLRLDTHTGWPGISDRLEDTVDYRTIVKRVSRLVKQSRFYLIEKLAAEIAAICLDEPRVEQVHVRVEKPAALSTARCVAVEIERTRDDLGAVMHRAFITLRSGAERHLRAAVERLHETTAVLALSPIYKSRPTSSTHPMDVFNAAALVETSMTPAQLKRRLSGIKKEVDRESTNDTDADASINLAIALYDDEVFDLGSRQIPAPDILTEACIAVPLADLAPAYRHPETKAPLEDIAEALPKADLERTNITL